MRKQKIISLGSAIEEWIIERGFKQKLHEAQLINQWSNIVGERMAKNTQNLRIEKGVLHLRLSSGLALQEMYIIRQPLRDKINQLYGYELIKDILIER